MRAARYSSLSFGKRTLSKESAMAPPARLECRDGFSIGPSGAIPELLRAGGVSAVGAAIDAPFLLHAVADDAAIAVGASRREGLDGALEAVERVRGASHRDLKGLVVLVSAHLTASGGH